MESRHTSYESKASSVYPSLSAGPVQPTPPGTVSGEAEGQLKQQNDVHEVRYIQNNRRTWQLCINGYPFVRNRKVKNTQHWVCSKYKTGCRARAASRIGEESEGSKVKLYGDHYHQPKRLAEELDEYDTADDDLLYMFIVSREGGFLLVQDNHIYRSNLRRHGSHKNTLYWECVHYQSVKCPGRLKSVGNILFSTNTNVPHNHQPDLERINEARLAGKHTYRSFYSLFK